MKEQKEKMKQLKLGMQVDCQDGKAGKVSKLIADPQSRRAGYLVVKMRVLRQREVVVPVVSNMGVRLYIDARFADGLPTFLDELADGIVP